MNFININKKNIMLITLTIVIALFSFNILNLQNIHITSIASQNEKYNDENYLYLNFNQDIDIKVLDNLFTNNNYSKTEIVFNSLTGLTDIAGKTEQIIINGEYEAKSLLNEFNYTINEMVSKVNHIGSGGQVKNISAQDYELVKNRIKSYNQLDLFRYKLGLNFFKTKVTELKARGTKKTLTSLNNKLKTLGIIKSSEFIDVNLLTTEFNTLKNEIDNELKANNLQPSLTKTTTTLEQKLITIINEKLNNYYNHKNIQNTINTNINVNKEVIEKVDKLIKTDQSGSKIISDFELESLNLNSSDFINIKKLISEFNFKKEFEKIPVNLILKDVKIIKTPVVTILEKLVNGVESNAGWCQRDVKFYTYWWGNSMLLNGCAASDLINGGGAFSLAIGIASISPCAALCVIFAGIMGIYSYYINWLNTGCNNNGVWIYRNWGGVVWFGGNC